MPFQSVRQRRRDHDSDDGKGLPTGRRKRGAGARPSNGKSSARGDAGSLRQKGIR
jgi:hypothetical protein